jgi:hypothetical protein
MADSLNDKKGHTSSFAEDPGIDVSYGQKTWAPRQSVVDVIQNHLDANTTEYEKRLLKIAGVHSYDPESKEQQELLILLERTKRGEGQQVRAQLHAALQRQAPSDRPLEDIATEVQEVPHELPRLQLKVSDGAKARWIEYGEMSSLPSEWTVKGFRVYDSGSGFDHQLLGMMGASTKKTNGGKRGGLGEGLKMSVAHLVRSGASIRMFSRNRDGTWVARPSVEGNQMVFQGKRKEQQHDEDATGSVTEIDFSVSEINPDLVTEWADMLDPRKGEGLGRYVLEYRDEKFLPMTNLTAEVSGLGVERGRIYVKGLLVQEDKNLLFSYNLGDKWAISGRDRKTVRREALVEAVQTALERLNDSDRISYLLEAVSGGSTSVEVQELGGSLKIPPAIEPLWREAIERIFRFEVGTVIFAPDDLTSDRERWAEEKGFKIRRIPAACRNAIPFFQGIYPGKVISFAQLSYDGSNATAARTSPTEIKPQKKDNEEQALSDESLPPEDAEYLEGIQHQFMRLLLTNAIDEMSHGIFRPVEVDHLRSLTLAALPPSLKNGGRPFHYDKRRNVLYVLAGIPRTYQTTLDAHLELLKIATNRDVFDTWTQDVLTRMAGMSMAHSHPLLRTDLGVEKNIGRMQMDKLTTYSPDQKEEDNLIIECRELAERINTQALSKAEVEDCLTHMREISKQLGKHKSPASISNRFLHWEGKVYRIDNHFLRLEEVDFSVKTPEPEVESHPKPKTERTGEHPWFNFPMTLTGHGSEEIEAEKVEKKEKTEETPLIEDELDSGFGTNDRSLRRILSESSRLFRMLRLSKEIGDAFSFGSRRALPEPQKRLLQPTQQQNIQANEVSYLPYNIEDGDQLQITLSEDKGEESSLRITRRNGKLMVAQQTKHGLHQSLSPIGRDFFFGGGSLFIFNSVLEIRSSKACKLEVREEKDAANAQLPERNRGKDFLKTSVSLDYGKEVWNDPKRILLDAVQNHIDAQGRALPAVVYTVVSPQNQLQEVNSEQLQQMGNEWRIIGVNIQDTGEGYPTPYLSVLGSTTKGEEDIGKYGEGLKMLAASALRQGIHIELSSRDWQAKPRAFEQTVKDYEADKERKFTMLGYDLKWLEQDARGSSTHFALFPIQQGQSELTPEQIVALDEKLGPRSNVRGTWECWTAVLDPRNANQQGQRGLARYALEEKSEHGNGIVTVLPSCPGKVYEKGLLVPADTSYPMLFGYNLDATIINTRERNAYSKDLFEKYVRDYFAHLADKEIMKAILVAVRDHPDRDYYEYQYLGGDSALWRQTYYEVFGDDAVLSMRPILWRQERAMSRSMFSMLSMMSEGHERHYERLAKVVGSEAHLENANLRILPETITAFFDDNVYTSKDFEKALHASEMELPADLRQRLFAWVQEANGAIVETLNTIETDTEKAGGLHAVVSHSDLQKKRQVLNRMKTEGIKVKHRNFPGLGIIEANDEDEPVVSLNERVLQSPRDLLDTYVHELAHFLSGQKDYVLNFQRFLMLLALSGQKEA